MDPILVSVIGVAEDGQIVSSEQASSIPGAVKVKKIKSSESNSMLVIDSVNTRDSCGQKDKGKSSKRYSLPANSSKPSTDSKLEAMNQKWPEKFSRLEATLLSKTFRHPEQIFQSVKITPTKLPPASAVETTQPFYAPTRPTDRLAPVHQQSSMSTNQPCTD